MNIGVKTIVGFWLYMCVGVNAFAQVINWQKPNKWVDSVYQTLTEDQRITQLIMLAAFSSRDSAHLKELECAVREQHVGGLIFFKGSPTKQAQLTNYYQSIAKVPLLIGIDAEWGVAMRLDSVMPYPRQMVLGAAQNEDLAYEMGVSVGRQCKRMGIHINFAPVIDINNNPNNPVINDRSFGENKFWVAKLGSQYAQGMQAQKVIACAKHFPGHGDTEADSHYSLPLVTGNRKRLDSLELYPFKDLIRNGVMGIMTAHLNVPALDSTPNTPSSLSKPIVTNLLKTEMGFTGIVVTDALNMKGVTDYYRPGEVTAKALAAGNDLLEFVEDVSLSVAMIKLYIEKGEITWEQIERSCKKILLAKYWAGLAQYKPIELNNLISDLNCCDNFLTAKKIIKRGIVVAKNEDKIIPIDNPELYRIAIVAVGSNQLTPFQEMAMNYCKADYYSIDKGDVLLSFDTLLNVLKGYNLIVLSLHNTSRFVSKKLGLTPLQIDFVRKILALEKKVILVNNGNPYILGSFSEAKNVIVSFEDLEENNKLAVQVLFGANKSTGILPVTVNQKFGLGIGIETEVKNRFSYIYPEEKNISYLPLQFIDTLVLDAIAKGAMPGAQVLVAKDGKVIYQKAFGYHTYDNLLPVTNYHLYDLASLTKMLATTVAIMKLYDDHKIKLDATLGEYLPEVKGSNKEKLLISDIMLHQAGLVAFVPFYKKTLMDGKPSNILYSEVQDSNYTIPVATNLYLHQQYLPQLWEQIIATDVKKSGEYIYSDIGFILLRRVVETQSGMPFEQYIYKHIYQPLSLALLVFNPLQQQINTDWIVPTEADSSFRQQLLRGTVHDQTAAMLGGISGHAGLFGNANDVAIVMQLLLDGGSYGNKRIIKESTVELFTKKYAKTNRRGLGFDKQETDTKKASPVSRVVSPQAFGHTGFTGTCAWADPKNKTVYVFLSNRVHPNADNKKLVEMNVRTRIQDIIYEAVQEK